MGGRGGVGEEKRAKREDGRCEIRRRRRRRPRGGRGDGKGGGGGAAAAPSLLLLLSLRRQPLSPQQLQRDREGRVRS